VSGRQRWPAGLAGVGRGRTQRRQRGLTLVELMVVVAVMIILASLVYPMYSNLVRKARRSEARVALNSLAMAEQRYFTVNGRFATTAQLGTTYTDVVSEMSDRDGNGSPDYYSIAVVPTTTTFTITATVSGTQTSDSSCTTLVIDELGSRTATGGDPNKCW